MPTLRLPRLGCSISGWRLGSIWKPPMLMKPRWVSPRPGCSTLMTSAPQSARIAPAAGTKVNWATSRTRTPAITLITSLRLSPVALGRMGSPAAEDRRAALDERRHALLGVGRGHDGLLRPGLFGQRGVAVDLQCVVDQPLGGTQCSGGPGGQAPRQRQRGGDRVG